MTAPGPVALPDLTPAQFEAWQLLVELDTIGVRWVLIGGQMMFLLAAEHGATLPRATPDADVLVDVRASPCGIARVCEWLRANDLQLEGISVDGIGHRFVKLAGDGVGVVEFDVLAPEGLSESTDISTSDASRTVTVPGSVPLLANAEEIHVVCTDMMTGATCDGPVHRPTVLDAIIGKCAATTLAVRTNPERDWQDLALLLTLVEDFDRVPQVSKAGRRHLRRIERLTNADHNAWLPYSADQQRTGQVAARLILRRLDPQQRP